MEGFSHHAGASHVPLACVLTLACGCHNILRSGAAEKSLECLTND